MTVDIRPCISERAEALLQHITPERCPISKSQGEHPVTQELQHLGLVIVEWFITCYTIRLSPAGKALRPSVRN